MAMTDTMLSRLAAALRECSDALECTDTGAGGLACVERARALLAEWEEKKQQWRQAVG
jgi:hypothetical protein